MENNNIKFNYTFETKAVINYDIDECMVPVKVLVELNPEPNKPIKECIISKEFTLPDVDAYYIDGEIERDFYKTVEEAYCDFVNGDTDVEVYN